MNDLKFKIVVPGDSPVQIFGSSRLNSLKEYADVILYQDLLEQIIMDNQLKPKYQEIIII